MKTSKQAKKARMKRIAAGAIAFLIVLIMVFGVLYPMFRTNAPSVSPSASPRARAVAAAVEMC